MKNKVFFLTRAYNDLDCRMPLLLEFCKDKKYHSVSIIGIPTNKGINNPKKHELSKFLLENNIQITTIYNLANNKPLLKAIYLFYDKINQNHLNKLLAKAFNKIKKQVFRIILFLSARDKIWIEKIIQYFKSSIIIMDEIAFQKGRSFFVDELIKKYNIVDYSIYSFSTGQDTFLNLWHDKKVDYGFKLYEKACIPLFVPSKNDKNVMLKKLPVESIDVVGNTRFDSSWINTLAEIASKNIEKDHLLKKNSNKKIVFMLSKIEYGVDLQNLVETINICATIENSCVIIKPHTRGMTLDATKNQLNNNVYNGTKYSSNELTVWADTVLFTGSSIIFQAMLLKKKVIYLKHCHKYNTIFDDSDAVLIANSANDVKKFVIEVGIDKTIQEKVDNFLKVNIHNGINSGLVCKNIKNQIEQWESSNLKGSET